MYLLGHLGPERAVQQETKTEKEVGSRRKMEVNAIRWSWEQLQEEGTQAS